jgi:hypothetical protein
MVTLLAARRDLGMLALTSDEPRQLGNGVALKRPLTAPVKTRIPIAFVTCGVLTQSRSGQTTLALPAFMSDHTQLGIGS